MIAAANDDDDLWNAAHEQSRTEDRTPKPSLGEYDEDPGREASKSVSSSISPLILPFSTLLILAMAGHFRHGANGK